MVHILTRKEQLGSTAFQMNLPPGMSGYCAKRTTVTTAEVRLADLNNRGMLPSTERSCLGQVLLLAELENRRMVPGQTHEQLSSR